jgi:hypothetical protein
MSEGAGRGEGDVQRIPEPDEKPHPHAQWDEVEGKWILWNDETQRWEDVEDA